MVEVESRLLEFDARVFGGGDVLVCLLTGSRSITY